MNGLDQWPVTYDVVDLFAGSGWGVATKWLGLKEIGLEVMPEAIRTRDLNGLETLTTTDESGKRVGVSVADLKTQFVTGIRIHIASPPCQTFSTAGKGKGRLMLDRVLQGVNVVASGDVFRPDDGDPRTWLVLEPLRVALASRPEFIIWEQVPPVLPVWEACAEVLRKAHGYSVWAGCVQAEMYGVPQTRRRALLIARRDGIPAGPPPATHSRYYNREPERLDPGVAKWVSMSEALGWPTGLVRFPRLADEKETVRIGNVLYRARDLRTTDHPAFNLTEKARSWKRWVYRGSNTDSATRRPLDAPAPTVMFGARSNKVEWMDVEAARDRTCSGVRVTVGEAAALQTFPAEWEFGGSLTKQFLQIGNAVPPLLAYAVLKMFVET